MFCVRLASETDFEGWRRGARALRLADVPPDQVVWRVGQEADLFGGSAPKDPTDGSGFAVSRAFVTLAQDVLLHRTPERFALLYQLLWRLRDEPHLLALVTDAQVARAGAMQKQVRDAEHKMHAFTRFRKVEVHEGPETFVAWFEPPHYVVERGAAYFVERVANLRFSISTPDLCAHWDGDALGFTPGVQKDHAPADDELESYWSTYFSAIFNPARLNEGLMTRQMPKHYWRNLPEAAAIPAMVQDARGRAQTMIQAEPTEPSARVRRRGKPEAVAEADEPSVELKDPGEVVAALQTCRRCELWRNATQAVAGEGPRQAQIMLIGEQPGDLEDLRGRPFVGPAGELLNRALEQAGVPRDACYVTNAVKHFKWEPRGKRRLHQRPDAGEIQACRWWLDQERRLVHPRVIVALGATAAMAVFGRSISVTKARGPAGHLDGEATGFVTVHPSYLLRLPDEASRSAEFTRFVADLRAAYALAGAV